MLYEQAIIKLKNLAINNTLPHAILFMGEQNKNLNLAKLFSQWLLCEDPKSMLVNYICDCASCSLILSNNHPDLKIINLGIDQEIKIGDIRLANEFASTNPYLSRRKILLINHAHNLNIEAANAFLKFLEEPNINNAEILFLLISNNYTALPLTVLSRVICLKVNLENSVNLIEENIFSSLQVQILQDLYDYWVAAEINLNEIVVKWEKIPKEQLIDCLWFIVCKLIIGARHEILMKINAKIPATITWILLDSLNYLNKLITLGVPINWSLFLYNFLLTKVTGDNIYASRARQ